MTINEKLDRLRALGCSEEQLTAYLSTTADKVAEGLTLEEILEPSRIIEDMIGALKLFSRHRDKEMVVYSLLVKATTLYGFNQADFMVFDPETREFKHYLAVGPVDEREHKKVLGKIAQKTITQIVDEYDPKNDRKLNERLSGLTFTASDGSIFFDMVDLTRDHQSFEGERPLNPANDQENKLIQAFGTDRCAMIVVKGLDGNIIGYIYGNWVFDNNPYRIDRNKINLYRYIASTFIQFYESEDRHQRIKRLATLGEIVAKVAHQLKNPITAAGGFIGRSLRRYPDVKREDLEVCKEELERIERIVAELSNMAKKPVPDIKPFDIYQVTADYVQRQFETHQLGVSLGNQEVIMVNADLDHTRLILQCLVENMIYEMEHSKPINGLENKAKIAVTREDNWAVVSLTNPHYIPPDTAKRIFAPFFTTKEDQGTGLGLVIAMEYVGLNRGKITVHSDEHNGTTFKVYLPLAK